MAGEKTVGDYVSLQRGLTYKGPLVGEPGPALLGLGSIVPGGGFRHDYKTYGGECPQTLMLKPGDLFVSLKGATKDGEMIGSVARVPPTVPSGRLTQDTVGLRFQNGNSGTVSYLYWVLRTPQYRDYCRGRATGSAVVALSRSDFLNYPVPELTEDRQQLALLFDAIEDKIELNRRRNRTLEAMARAIFQSWFVDFDPVKAKAAGRTPPGLSPALSALFPDSFEDSPLRPIPKGWRVRTIKEHANRIQYGLTTSAKQEAHGPKFLRITDIRGGAVDWSSVPYCEASDDDREKYQIRDGDIFVARTGASTGENVYLVDPPASVFASYLVRFQFTNRGFGRIVGEFMRSSAYFEFVKSAIGGSAQPNANAQTLAGVSLVLPSEPIADNFYTMVRPFDLQRSTQDQESRALAALRDALLPKLVSGELRVADAERIVGRAL